MTEIIRKGCGAADSVKNGKVRGLQRSRCKACKGTFTATQARGMPAAAKALGDASCDAMGNMSFCGIARLLGVSAVAVLKWIRQEAEALPAPEMRATVEIVMRDEMHHFLQKKRRGFDSDS